MAYGTPTDPVAGTVITVAYAVANILEPIRALRAFTGGSDPPGSNYWLRSTSTSAVSWVTRASEVLAAIGFTPVNKAGDTMTGNLVFSDILEGIILAGGSHIRDDNTPASGSLQILAEQGRFNVYNESSLPLLSADYAGGLFTFKGLTIWHSGNAGTGPFLPLTGGTISGGLAITSVLNIGGTTTAGAINAGAIGGSTGTFSGALAALSGAFTNAVTAASAAIVGLLTAGSATISGALSAASAAISGNATVGGTLGVTGVATFTAQPLVGAEIISRVKAGTYVGNGAAGVTISVGFTVKCVSLSWVGTNGLDHGHMMIVSTVAGTSIAHGDNGQVYAGIQDSAVLSGTGFVVYGSGGAFDALSNIGTATTTYYWVAWG